MVKCRKMASAASFEQDFYLATIYETHIRKDLNCCKNY